MEKVLVNIIAYIIFLEVVAACNVHGIECASVVNLWYFWVALAVFFIIVVISTFGGYRFKKYGNVLPFNMFGERGQPKINKVTVQTQHIVTTTDNNKSNMPMQQPFITPLQPHMMPPNPNMVPQQPNMMPQHPNMMPQQPNMMPQQPNTVPQQPAVYPPQRY